MYGPPHWAALKAVHTHTNMCTYMQLWIHVLCLAAQCVYTCTLLTLVLLHFRGLYVGYIQCSPTRSCHCSRLTDCSGWAAEPAGDNNTSSVLPSCCLAVVLLPSVATGWGQSVVLLSQLETQDAEDTQAQTQFWGDTQTAVTVVTRRGGEEVWKMQQKGQHRGRHRGRHRGQQRETQQQTVPWRNYARGCVTFRDSASAPCCSREPQKNVMGFALHLSSMLHKFWPWYICILLQNRQTALKMYLCWASLANWMNKVFRQCERRKIFKCYFSLCYKVIHEIKVYETLWPDEKGSPCNTQIYMFTYDELFWK